MNLPKHTHSLTDTGIKFYEQYVIHAHILWENKSHYRDFICHISPNTSKPFEYWNLQRFIEWNRGMLQDSTY